MHGFEITQWLEARSGGAVGVHDSALYQALRRMEERGLVSIDGGVTENNQRARYYKITKADWKRPTDEAPQWVRYARAATDILTSTPTKG